MEHSCNTLNDFEFKYIPKKEFEKMVTRVERDRKFRNTDVWGSFCSVTSGKDDSEELAEDYVTKRNDVKVMTDFDIQSVIQSIDKKEIMRRIPSTPAPFFGPARKLDVETLQQQQKKLKRVEEESSEASSVHIVEEVNLVEKASDVKSDAKIQVQKQTDDDGADDGASGCSSIEKEVLQSELLKLCFEIENANGTKASGDESSVDLTYQEEREDLQNIIDETEEKINCEKNSKFIDKKFDFLYRECKSSDEEDEEGAIQAQTFPLVELRQKSTKSKKFSSDGDFTNDNNVWIPKTENQIRKSGRQKEREKSGVKKKRNGEVFPSDVIIRKALEVGKLKFDGNEKSKVGVKVSSNKEDEQNQEVSGGKLRLEAVDNAPSKADLAVALGKISLFQNKICQYLDYLREIIEEPPELEDKNDLKKRQLRATEFSNRFARNHLYQIGRIAEEVRLMPDNPVDLARKVNLLFQVIMQAVQTYLKNVEMIIYNHYPDKLLVLVDFIINAMKVCFDRMVFDKRDLLIQQMMRKCLNMKQYLEMNKQSFAKFAQISESRKSALFSRSSFAFEIPHGSKLSMYDSVMTKQKPSTSRGKQGVPSKSPYEVPKSRKLQSSHSNITDRSKAAPSRFTSRDQSRINSPKVKRTVSNVSTAMQKLRNDGSNDDVAEKPLEDSETNVVEESKKTEIMEMMQSIAWEKVQEMLMPLFSGHIPKKNVQQSAFEVPKTLALKELPPTPTKQIKPKPSPRVTSEVEDSYKVQQEKIQHETIVKPEMSQSTERVQRISKNVQYLYVKSNAKEVQNERSVIELQTEVLSNNEPTVHIKPKTKVLAADFKPPVPIHTKELDDDFLKEMKKRALKERLKYVSQMMENPLYMNEVHSEPWKMFAEISDHILDEMIQDVASNLDFGEKSFVAKFLQHELEC